MGSLKLEQRQKVESDQERGQKIQEVGEQKIEEAEILSHVWAQIEAIDDDDKAAVDAARSESDGIAKALVESEDNEFSRFLRGEIGIDDIIPDESPIYLNGPGFDDGSAEELAYLHKKYPNVILMSDDLSMLQDDGIFPESNAELKDSMNMGEEAEESGCTIKHMLTELENIF